MFTTTSSVTLSRVEPAIAGTVPPSVPSVTQSMHPRVALQARKYRRPWNSVNSDGLLDPKPGSMSPVSTLVA